MIYGSTGATHFDQLAKILTGYEITGARSSGIFMGILFIAVGSLFKITAERLDERGDISWVRKKLSEIEMSILFFIEKEEGRGDSSLPSGFACRRSNKEFRLGPGKRWQQHKERGPCSCCARPLSSRFGIYYKRENPLQITTSLLGQRVEWPRADQMDI
ncbi:unnamed protein product [Alopecurus aequalis]